MLLLVWCVDDVELCRWCGGGSVWSSADDTLCGCFGVRIWKWCGVLKVCMRQERCAGGGVRS